MKGHGMAQLTNIEREFCMIRIKALSSGFHSIMASGMLTMGITGITNSDDLQARRAKAEVYRQTQPGQTDLFDVALIFR